jgi:hypothetical protein
VEQVHAAAVMILLYTADQRAGGSRESDEELLECVMTKCKIAAAAVVDQGNTDPQRNQNLETASANFWACALLQQAVCDANGGAWMFPDGHNAEWVTWDKLKASVESLEGMPSYVPSEWQVDFRARGALAAAADGGGVGGGGPVDGINKRRRHTTQKRTICKHGFGKFTQQLKKMELLHSMLVLGGDSTGLHEAIRQMRPPQRLVAPDRSTVRLGGARM